MICSCLLPCDLSLLHGHFGRKTRMLQMNEKCRRFSGELLLCAKNVPEGWSRDRAGVGCHIPIGWPAPRLRHHAVRLRDGFQVVIYLFLQIGVDSRMNNFKEAPPYARYQYCFIWRPSYSTVSEDAGIEPRNVANLFLQCTWCHHWQDATVYLP